MDLETFYVYTRKQAIEDGALIDVTSMALEASFKVPVAVTQGVYETYINPSSYDEKQGQSASGRLWDTLFMLNYTIRTGNEKKSELLYEVIYVIRGESRKEKLKAIMHGGDEGEPVITIMLPNED